MPKIERGMQREREVRKQSLVRTSGRNGEYKGLWGGRGGGETGREREKLEKRVDYFTAIRADRKRRGQ